MAKSKSSLFNTENSKPMSEDAMNKPESSLASYQAAPNKDDDIQDIDLSIIKKKRFRVNGDSSSIIELNTSDISITERLDIAYKKLTALMEEVSDNLQNLPENADDVSEDEYDGIMALLKRLDSEMREQVDFIFETNVSEVCAPFGNMWDPIDGMFRYEHIINILTKLYETNINAEFAKMRSKINQRISKYTKKKKN